jgi:hypothetical protein
MYTRVHTCRPLGRQGRGPCLHLVVFWTNERSEAKFRPSEFAGTLLFELAQKKFPICKKTIILAVQNSVEISSKTEESELMEGFV